MQPAQHAYAAHTKRGTVGDEQVALGVGVCVGVFVAGGTHSTPQWY